MAPRVRAYSCRPFWTDTRLVSKLLGSICSKAVCDLRASAGGFDDVLKAGQERTIQERGAGANDVPRAVGSASRPEELEAAAPRIGAGRGDPAAARCLLTPEGLQVTCNECTPTQCNRFIPTHQSAGRIDRVNCRAPERRPVWMDKLRRRRPVRGHDSSRACNCTDGFRTSGSRTSRDRETR
jgi:hypothetical protein